MARQENTIKDQIINFYNEELFQKLNAYYGKTTLFNILKIERNENRHSAFLAWLLDVKGSHGLGEEPLKKFMRLLAWAEKDSKYDNPFLAGNYHFESVRVRLEHLIDDNRRIDVYTTFDCYEKGEKDKLAHRFCIIIENKVYTEENGNQTQFYYEWAKKDKENKGATIIGVFLSPDKEKTCSCQEFIKIDYQELLSQVIEPLLALKMSDEARWMISDYIVNLGQPKKLMDEDGNEVIKEDTILAVSKENTGRFAKLYEKHKNLLNSALFAFCYDEKKKKLKKESILKTVFQSDFSEIKSNAENDLELLKSFWATNEMLLKMFLDTALRDNNTGVDEETSKKYEDAVNALLNLKSSNRNTKTYLFNGQTFSVKGRLCHAIVKCYAEQHKDFAVSDLQSVFRTPVKNDDKIVTLVQEAQKTKDSSGKEGGNYYMKQEDWIPVKDGNVVVWSYWPDRFFLPFKECVKVLGYVIEEIE